MTYQPTAARSNLSLSVALAACSSMGIQERSPGRFEECSVWPKPCKGCRLMYESAAIQRYGT